MAVESKTIESSEHAFESEIIATGVSLEDYMERYTGQHCEWIDGVVIMMSPGELKHNDRIYYLFTLLDAYFELRLIGRVIGQPFVMRLPAFPNRRREPDLLVVLSSNPNELKETYMDGPADICIEIVSPESTIHDHGEKFAEYEQGGVPEYWIVDPLRTESRFYRLNEEGHYNRHLEDEHGYYRTPALPGLAVAALWQEKLPGPGATFEFVKQVLQVNE